jgi:hypothetical protein
LPPGGGGEVQGDDHWVAVVAAGLKSRPLNE